MTAAIPPLAASDVERLLRDWRALNEELPGLTFEQVEFLYLKGRLFQVRYQVLRRIYGRFNRLRMLNELKELETWCKPRSS